MEPSFENKTKALDWNEMAFTWIRTARWLFHEKQPLEIVLHVIHQSVMYAFKAVYAYYGLKLKGTTSIMMQYKFARSKIDFFQHIKEEDLRDLIQMHQNNQAPGPNFKVPDQAIIQRFYTLAVNINHIVGMFIMNRPQQILSGSLR